MNKNSIEIYHTKILPDLKRKHERVIGALVDLGGSATVYEIADRLNTAVHNISGRLTELSGYIEYERPVIKADGRRTNKYGNPCTVWALIVRSEGKQQILF
jgi:hypothetical protein